MVPPGTAPPGPTGVELPQPSPSTSAPATTSGATVHARACPCTTGWEQKDATAISRKQTMLRRRVTPGQTLSRAAAGANDTTTRLKAHGAASVSGTFLSPGLGAAHGGKMRTGSSREEAACPDQFMRLMRPALLSLSLLLLCRGISCRRARRRARRIGQGSSVKRSAAISIARRIR